MHNSYDRMHEAHEASFFSSTLTACGLFVSLALLLLAPAPAQAQTCYAEADGDWSNADIWAPNAGDDPVGNNCDGGDGIPGSGETAVVTSGVSVDVASNNTVGTLDINDGAGGVFLNGGDLTVEGVATVGESTSPGSATLNTFEDDDPGTVTSSGKLTIQGSLTAYGDVKVFRQDGGTGELDVTGSSGTGDFTIESSGSFTGGPLAPANVAGTLTNNASSSALSSQRCYATTEGNWDDNTIWAPIRGTSASNTCDTGGNGNGVPDNPSGSNETAVVTSNVGSSVTPTFTQGVQVNNSNRTVGYLEMDDGAFGVTLAGQDLTVVNNITVGETTSPGGVRLNTYRSSGGSIVDEGFLTVQGSITVYGELNVARTGGGTGGIDVTSSNGSGNVAVESSGTINVNQLNSNSAPISIAGDLVNNGGDVNQSATLLSVSGELDNNSGTIDATNGANITANSFKNDGTLNLNGGELTASGNIAPLPDSENGTSSSATLDLGGGTLDVVHPFENGVNGTLDFSNSTLEFASDFTNNGTFTTGSNSLAVFDGGGGTQSLGGSLTGTNPNQSFVNFRVENNSVVEPDTKVQVGGKLTVKSGSRFGSDSPQEDDDLRYTGSDFSVNGDLFANIVEFAANNVDTTPDPNVANSYTTVTGAVFAEVNVLNTTAVEVGETSFTVFGLVDVFTNSILNVANESTTLALAADFNVDGKIEASSGTIKFNGEGESTACSLIEGSLDCSTSNTVQEFVGNAQTFNSLEIQDEDADSDVETEVVFSDVDATITVTSDLTIDEATLTTGRPITLQNGNLKVRNGGDITFSQERKLTFTGSNDRDVITPGGLEVSVVEVKKGSGGTQVLKNDLTVTDRLLMTQGELEPEQNLTIWGQLVLGGPVDASSTIDVANGGGTATLVSDQDLVSDRDLDAYVRYVDSDGDGVVDGSVNGDITYERQLSGSANWFYLASPQGTNNNNDTFSAFLEQGGENDLLTTGISGSDKENFEPSVQLYDETAPGSINPSGDAVDAGWKGIDFDCSNSDFDDCVSGMGSQMLSGRGYAVYVFNNGTGFPKTITSDVEPSTSDTSFAYAETDGSPTAEGPGIYVTDNDNDGVDKNEGWNLLGNPYFATIDFCTVRNSGGTEDIKPTVEVWDPGNAPSDGASGYASWNCSMDMGSGSTISTLDQGYIAPHQSFFVKAEPNGEDGIDELGLSINITEDQVNDNNYFLKRETEKTVDDKPPAVSLQFGLGELRYRTSVGFVDGAEKERGFHDGYYTDGAKAKSGPSFSSVADDGTLIATNALPRDFSDELTVPLTIDGCDYGSAISGSATISWPTFRNIPVSWGLTLEDTKTGETIDLSDASKYTFDYAGSCPNAQSKSTGDRKMRRPPAPSVTTHPSAKDGGAPSTRFKLHIDPDAVPPVELSEFTASAEEQAAVLSWTTTRERNLEAFHVQRKTDDGSFTTLENAVVESGASGESSTYEYQVDRLDAGTHTFRLEQVTTEGTTYSETVDVKIGLDGEYALSSYPNPVRSQATVEFAIKERADVSIALYNTLGQKVRTVYRGTPPGEETKRVSVGTQDLSSGVYFLRLEGEGVTGTQRMTVVK